MLTAKVFFIVVLDNKEKKLDFYESCVERHLKL